MEIENNSIYLKSLEDELISRLNQNKINFVRNGTNQLPGNISLSFKNAEGEMILHRMDLRKICVSTGSACDSVNTQVSHVIKAIGVPNEYNKGTIRISIGRNNTNIEIEKIAEAIVSILRKTVE